MGRITSIGAAALTAAAFLLAGCDIGCWFVPCDQARLSVVTVRDASGAALQGVHIEASGQAGETGANGCFALGGIMGHSRSLCVRAEKTGYKQYDECKPYNFYRIAITLQPVAAARASAATWTARSDPNERLTCPPAR